MNQISSFITTLIHYNVHLRDTLEYCLRKESFDPKLLEEKKRVIHFELENKTPLRNIIDSSGENGKKAEEALRNLFTEVYGDNGIVKIADDGVRVDHNQHPIIYKNVLPCRENVTNMIMAVLHDAKTKNLDAAEIEKAFMAEDRMYRAVAYLCLFGDLVTLFNEYNQARNDAKGAESPASNFIGQGISEVIKNINFIRGNAKETDLAYKEVEDKMNAFVENVTGRRDLPADKKFPDVIKETEFVIKKYLSEVETSFRSIYEPLIADFQATAKAEKEKGGAEKKEA